MPVGWSVATLSIFYFTAHYRYPVVSRTRRDELMLLASKVCLFVCLFFRSWQSFILPSAWVKHLLANMKSVSAEQWAEHVTLAKKHGWPQLMTEACRVKALLSKSKHKHVEKHSTCSTVEWLEQRPDLPAGLCEKVINNFISTTSQR